MRRREFVGALGAAAVGIRGARMLGLPLGRAVPASIADGVGVNVRLIEMTPRVLGLAQSLGFRWLRSDVVWAQVEQQVGNYDFSRQAAAFSVARSLGFRVLGILDYGHPVHTGGRGPSSDVERSHFVAFAQQAEQSLGHLVDAWEIWNEPNYRGFWQPAPNAADFAALVNAAAGAIWDITPTRQLVAGGLAGADFRFLATTVPTLATLSRRGPIAASVHPYRAETPETLLADLNGAGLVDRQGRAYAAPSVPLWITEWGYCRLRSQLGPAGQASSDARLPLVTAGLGVPVTILFELVDPKPVPAQVQCGDSYGLTESVSLAAHPAAIAVQAVLQRFGALSILDPGFVHRGSAWGIRTTGGTVWWSDRSPAPGAAAPFPLGRDTVFTDSTMLWIEPTLAKD